MTERWMLRAAWSSVRSIRQRPQRSRRLSKLNQRLIHFTVDPERSPRRGYRLRAGRALCYDRLRPPTQRGAATPIMYIQFRAFPLAMPYPAKSTPAAKAAIPASRRSLRAGGFGEPCALARPRRIARSTPGEAACVQGRRRALGMPRPSVTTSSCARVTAAGSRTAITGPTASRVPGDEHPHSLEGRRESRLAARWLATGRCAAKLRRLRSIRRR